MTPPFAKSWWVDAPRLLAGCYPGALDAAEHRRKLVALLDAGVRSVICLQPPDERGRDDRAFVPYEPLLKELAIARGTDVRCLRMPIRDMDVPTVPAMNAILDAIDGEIADGRPVYVHCWGGHGRTGTVIGCWLVRHGACGEAALQQITKLRMHDPFLRSQPAPQTGEQCAFVRKWAAVDRASRR